MTAIILISIWVVVGIGIVALVKDGGNRENR